MNSERHSFSLKRLLALLPRNLYGGLALVFVSAVVAAVFETVGVISILPFMAIVVDPEAVARYGWLSKPLKFVGAQSHSEAVLAIGTLTLAMLALGNAANAASTWIQQLFLGRVREALSLEIFEGFMRQPYGFHLKRDAASLLKVTFADVEAVLGGFLSPLLAAMARGVVAIVLLSVIVAYAPSVALTTLVLVGGSHWVVYRLVRERQTRLGRQMSRSAMDRSRSALEGVGGIKELRVRGHEAEAVRKFKDSTLRLVRAQVSNALTLRLPRHVLEVVAFGSIVVATMILIARGNGHSVIPALGLYAFAGYRLMPAFQQIFASAVAVRFSAAALESLEADLTMIRSTREINEAPTKSEPLPFAHEIQLDRVSFVYSAADRAVLRDVCVTIRWNESVGLVGRTGSGKTTLVDLLLGLHEPTSGVIRIDGKPLQKDTVRAWRKRVGYVPQHVFLANAPVSHNIAFGLPEDQIDASLVENAAKIAQADEFIRSLPQGYGTLVGERGARLSGGQRQRLGIARALYHNPDVLVFDEATSALDGLTEDAVMDAIRRLSTDRTVILIAHRLRTVKACNRIVMLENGKIVADGSYHNLITSSLPFKRLAGELDSDGAQASSMA